MATFAGLNLEGVDVGGGASNQELTDALIALNRSLEWQFQNLDSQNVREIGGWIVSNTDLMSRTLDVGMSTDSSLSENVRYWAGSMDRYNAPYRVYDSGRFVATDATITGNINMTGGNITWGSVPAPNYAQIAGSKPPVDANNTYNELLFNTGIRGFVNIGGTLYLSADYIRAGTITANYINTTNLAAEKLYKPGSPNNYLVVGGAAADLSLFNSVGTKVFGTYDNLDGSIDLMTGNYRFLTPHDSNDTTYARGNWVFLGSVSGVTARFA